MNFADELRHYNKKSERETITNANLNKDSALFIELIKNACIDANKKHKNSISVYFTSYLSDGYKEYGWTNCLPTIEYYRKSANEFNRGKNYDDGSTVSTNLGRYETRLYGNLIFFSQDRLSYANMLKKQLCNELNKMGFENFSVQIQQLDDIYVIHNRTASFFSRKVTETISVRKEAKIYVLNFKIHW